MINWNFSLARNDGASIEQVANILDGLDAAARVWNRYLIEVDVSLEIDLEIKELGGSTLASAGFRNSDYRGDNADGQEVFQPGPLHEIETDEDVNGSTEDGFVNVDLGFLNDGEFVFDTDIDDPNPAIPVGKSDFLTVMVHELGHVLGMTGVVDEADGSVDSAADAPQIFTFEDQLIDDGSGNSLYVGSQGTAVYGSSIPIGDSHAHFEESATDALMTPIISSGERDPLKPLDLAVWEDISTALRVPTSAADTLYGLPENADSIAAGDGGDRLFGLSGADTLMGEGGRDTLVGGLGGDLLDGGANADSADYSRSDAAVDVRLANATAQGGHATGDTLVSVENLVGTDQADLLAGDSGDNTLAGGAGGDRLIGGRGHDTVSYVGSDARVVVRLANDSARGGHADGDSLSGFESAVGSAHADVLFGDSGGNTLRGGGGDDVLIGGRGADHLDGRQGTDTVRYDLSSARVDVRLSNGVGSGGDAEGDTLTGVENVVGSPFADLIAGSSRDNRLEGGAGGDRLIGGKGMDTADYEGSEAAVSVRLAAGTGGGGDAEGDRLFGIENLLGSPYADLLAGDAQANALTGGRGDDRLIGGDGGDQLTGGRGADTADYSTSAAGVDVRLANQIARGGEAEGDVLSGIEHLTGSAQGDLLAGDSGANVLTGGGGGDRLIGGSGTDTAAYTGSPGGVAVRLYNGSVSGGEADGDNLSGIENLTGSASGDLLVGDSGANRLRGGGGDDTLYGGRGADRFEFRPGTDADTVRAWEDGLDRLDLSAFAFADFPAVAARASDLPNGLAVDLGGGDSVRVLGLSTDAFNADDVVL